MAGNKTVETKSSVEKFLDTVKDAAKRNDCFALIDLLRTQTGLAPKMWGSAIVGFGTYHYKYESGREGDSPLVAFSPRASSIALYLSGNFDEREVLLEKFGKHKASAGCIHIKTLADIDISVLQKMIANHITHIRKLYPDK